MIQQNLVHDIAKNGKRFQQRLRGSVVPRVSDPNISWKFLPTSAFLCNCWGVFQNRKPEGVQTILWIFLFFFFFFFFLLHQIDLSATTPHALMLLPRTQVRSDNKAQQLFSLQEHGCVYSSLTLCDELNPNSNSLHNWALVDKPVKADCRLEEQIC